MNFTEWRAMVLAAATGAANDVSRDTGHDVAIDVSFVPPTKYSRVALANITFFDLTCGTEETVTHSAPMGLDELIDDWATPSNNQ